MWPRTRDLTQELPALVEELHRRAIRVTRVAFNPHHRGPRCGSWPRTAEPSASAGPEPRPASAQHDR
ncbi:DUF5994 family protein [Geodermatophilus sp. URMC 61]|uniref:DUF5994 family protein n=1 Tax=Geodermatophilus sp. URMC 61 TaxID=3423411 RepID=UPI00406C5ED5